MKLSSACGHVRAHVWDLNIHACAVTVLASVSPRSQTDKTAGRIFLSIPLAQLSKRWPTKARIRKLLDDKIKADISEAIKPLLTPSKDSASSSASSSRVRRTLVSRLRGRFIALRPLFSKKIVCQFLISRPRQKILPRRFCRYILRMRRLSLLNDCKMASRTLVPRKLSFPTSRHIQHLLDPALRL